MSSPENSIDYDSEVSDDSDLDFIPGYTAHTGLSAQHAEITAPDFHEQQPEEDEEAGEVEPYEDEPLADADWIRQYNEEIAERRREEERLQQRFENLTEVLEW